MVLNSQVQIPLELQVQHALAVCAVCRSPLFSSGCPHCQISFAWSSTAVLANGYHGGVGLRRQSRPAELEGRGGLHDLPALRLRRRWALPHDGGVQPQAEAAAARTAPEEALQALDAHLKDKSRRNVKNSDYFALNY